MKDPIEEIYDSALKFLTPLTLDETYKAVVIEAVKILEGAMGTMFIAEKNQLKRVYSTSPQLLPTSPRKNGFTYSVYKSKKPLVLTYKQIYPVHPELAKTKMKYDLMVPLINRGKAIGVISILSRKKHFDKKDLSMLKLFAPLASLAIRKAQLYQELNNALNTRDLFISMASHELRTPITTVYTYMQLIRNKMKKGENFNSNWIETLLQEMTRLTRLVDELLQVSQIKTGDFKYDFEEVNLLEVLKKALSLFKTNNKGTEIIFTNKTELKKIILIGDQGKLTQVITNILDNSAKHNRFKRPVTLSLARVKKHVEIIIEDRGRGIRSEDLDNIFKEFYKGKGHTQSGMGLGLYLIKKIVDKHKGKISLESKLNKGTKVTVSLPILK